MEGLGQNPGEHIPTQEASQEEAFAQLKKREKELERLNEVQTNLAIAFFAEEEEIDQCLTRWITSGLSQKFRTLLENEELKSRMLSGDSKIFDDAYYEVLESLRSEHNEQNTN
jgi:hypothetical protein